jgi:hypothetical protein
MIKKDAGAPAHRGEGGESPTDIFCHSGGGNIGFNDSYISHPPIPSQRE